MTDKAVQVEAGKNGTNRKKSKKKKTTEHKERQVHTKSVTKQQQSHIKDAKAGLDAVGVTSYTLSTEATLSDIWTRGYVSTSIFRVSKLAKDPESYLVSFIENVQKIWAINQMAAKNSHVSMDKARPKIVIMARDDETVLDEFVPDSDNIQETIARVMKTTRAAEKG